MKLLATGNTAEVFEYGDDKVLKLYKSGYPFDAVQREYNNTLIMNKSPVKTPKVYEIVKQDGRDGIIFQKISGIDLLTEYFKNPGDQETSTRILTDLAGIQKTFLSFETSEGITYKDFLSYFNYDKLDSLPDGNAVCHGPKEYDVARTLILLTENNPAAEIIKSAYLQMVGMTFEQIEPFFDAIKWCRKQEAL